MDISIHRTIKRYLLLQTHCEMNISYLLLVKDLTRLLWCQSVVKKFLEHLM